MDNRNEGAELDRYIEKVDWIVRVVIDCCTSISWKEVKVKDQVDFGMFLEALSEFRRQDVAARPTAHTSSVSTRDWKRVEEALASKAERR